MLFLDFLLLITIVVCIAYCWILNRRIQDLQNSRIEFARMIKELNASIVKAEHNVQEMSELSKVTSKEIKEVVEEAKEMSAELMSIGEYANEVSRKLEIQAQTLENTTLIVEDTENYMVNLSSKAGEKFTDDDLPDLEEDGVKHNYTNHLKNFLQKVVTKKSNDPGANLNQMGYYNTLRKINLKK